MPPLLPGVGLAPLGVSGAAAAGATAASRLLGVLLLRLVTLVKVPWLGNSLSAMNSERALGCAGKPGAEKA
jgi:hypothetical protein